MESVENCNTAERIHLRTLNRNGAWHFLVMALLLGAATGAPEPHLKSIIKRLDSIQKAPEDKAPSISTLEILSQQILDATDNSQVSLQMKLTLNYKIIAILSRTLTNVRPEEADKLKAQLNRHRLNQLGMTNPAEAALEALSSFRKGDYEEALHLANALSATSTPASHYAALIRAFCLSKQGHTSQAVEILEDLQPDKRTDVFAGYAGRILAHYYLTSVFVAQFWPEVTTAFESLK